MTRTDLTVELYKSVPIIFEPPCIYIHRIDTYFQVFNSMKTLIKLVLHIALKNLEKKQYDPEQINTNLWICR
jgi:hypothetical protein